MKAQVINTSQGRIVSWYHCELLSWYEVVQTVAEISDKLVKSADRLSRAHEDISSHKSST